MKMYIFIHLTGWCLVIRHVVEGLAFPAFVDDICLVARQADAAGHILALPREEILRWSHPPVVSLKREVVVAALRRFAAVGSFLLCITNHRFILHLRLSLGCSFAEFCCEHQVAGREILPRLGVFEHHIEHVRQVCEAEVTLYPSRHVRFLDVLCTVAQAFG